VAETRLNRYWVIALIFLIAVIIVTVFIAWSRYRPSQPIEILLPPEQEISGNISIHGAVINPGIYQFSGGDTIGSLIQAAGGMTANGKSDSLELNIPQAAGATGTPQKININRAEAWLLEAPAGNRTDQSKRDYRLPPAERFLPQCRRTDKSSGY
jgi:hypothetical protein